MDPAEPGPSDDVSSSSPGIELASRPRLTQTSRSRLESLPAELLEKIFFHSLEINLPRASWHIARVLSNPIIYKWLIRVAFASPNLSSKHDFFTPDFLPPPLDFWALSTAERTHLQTVILGCRWSTLELIRESQREYMQQVIRQKCKDLVFSIEDEQVLSTINAAYERPMDFDLATSGRRGSGDFVLKAKAPPAADADNATEASATDMRVAFWIHFGGIQIREPTQVSYEIDLFRLPCPPSPDERPRMPNKLLRAPWTPKKLEFLLLLSQEAYIDEDTHSSDRTHHVLRQLIRDRDYYTFERLLNMNVVTKNYSYPQKWPVKIRHFRAALKHAEGLRDPFVRLLCVERWNVLGSREWDLKDEVLRNVDGALAEEAPVW